MSKQSNTFERFMESAIFASRWILAPFFIGLIIAMLVLLLKFGKELVSLLMGVLGLHQHDSIISILTLVDTALIAVLLLIIVFSGYENFVSKLSIGDHEDRPAWMGKVSFSDLKMKLIGAIVAISAVELLKAFLVSTTLTGEQIGWKIAIHLTFVISGLLFAASDWISDNRKNN
ncbi:TIGR00645 family protein [Hydrogenophaga sp.]|uniref:TIGR00645 family protein n=1 Tax=Hydrogenophaga sp. TaxID=1904254 RepID=UPI0025BDFEA9|nr:TIGR00645 family protein [Hydrogenophaga sp.]MBT9466665.1 TIGR00645 family protein [Hydrogenophaga sp.]